MNPGHITQATNLSTSLVFFVVSDQLPCHCIAPRAPQPGRHRCPCYSANAHHEFQSFFFFFLSFDTSSRVFFFLALAHQF